MTKNKWLELDEKARTVLLRNDRGGYTVPRPNLYPTNGTGIALLQVGGFQLLIPNAHGKN